MFMTSAIASPLRVLIVDADLGRRTRLVQSLQANNCVVTERSDISLDLLNCLAQLQPDVIVIDADAPDRDTLEHVCMISRDQPRPIVMFTDDDDAAKIEQAMRAGVTSYVVKGIAPERIKPILQVAMLRFAEHQALRQDLAQAQNQLAERKLIERAKGIVMQQKKISEDAAYKLLRKMAMQRNAKLADIAAQVVDLAQVLG
jgi:response regulator NasT